ncbi:enoyl-CoA hydratase/isomerase family protein [Bosea sp. (in: a-proteobacteria)]|uniref:enoyl-CoA hydratase/isomerase family protein n=1 Tax=Bosea sp. (in: a-proteobacteria) TaxID=1871050 RepID=UPI0026016DBA|nr:enoyl-CoA hydratase/isomerase family protein [Bosea sp. (in: a-proteobacteria)]MCO5089510.1 enoyl-CoA hydratase/isomerase family protein [Bosea sp. (in: a-proteobacteria)]
MSSELVTYESQDGVAVITLSRPEKLNAFNPALALALEAAWKRLAASDDRVAVLTGAGSKAFTAGADLKDPPLVTGYGYVPNIGVEVDKPIIAAVRGWCIGVGVVLVQQADLCVASDTTFFRYPEGRIGVGRGLLGGLAARIPHKIAVELMMLGQDVSAERMLQYGFVNSVTPSEDVLPTAMEWARILAEQDGSVTRYFKQSLLAVLPKSPGEVAERTRWINDQLPGNRSWGGGGATPGASR